MRKFSSRSGLWVMGSALSALLACQNTQQATKPGAMPSGVTDVAPRLNASTYVAHGDLLETQGNFEQAILQYRQALELTPDLVAARNRLGVVLNKVGRHDEATAEFRQAVARSPGSAYLLNNLGFSLYLETKYAEAEQVLTDAVKLQPTFRRAQLNRGVVLAKLGRYDEALAAFSLGGSEADAYYNLAVMQAEDQHYAIAARSLEQALRLNPDFAAARQQLKEIARLAAADEEAERVAVASAPRTDASVPLTPPTPAVEDVQLAAAVEVAPARPPETPVPPSPDEATPAGAILREIGDLLAVADIRPLDDAECGRAHILVVLFDEMVAQSPPGVPIDDSRVRRLKDLIANTGQPDAP